MREQEIEQGTAMNAFIKVLEEGQPETHEIKSTRIYDEPTVNPDIIIEATTQQQTQLPK